MSSNVFFLSFFQKAFEGISDNFKKPLTEEQRQAIEEILNKLPVEQIDILVELIFECIPKGKI
jgi:cyclopropane fatty-acyl-phospholipid synthase-like methyltransferase